MSNEIKNNNSLLKTNVKLDPVAVVYNISASLIEKTIYDYFVKSGINGVSVVRVQPRKSGNRPEVLVYAFFNKDSEDVISNLDNVPPHLRNRMGSTVYKPSEKLSRALRGVAKGGELAIKDGLVYVKLNIFKCLAIALNCDPRVNTIVINEVLTLKKDNNCILSVIKGLKYSGGSTTPVDKYSRIIDSLDR